MNIAVATDQLLPQSATDTKQVVSMASALASAGNTVTVVAPRLWLRDAPRVDAVASFYGVAPSFQIETVASAFPSLRGIEKVAHAIAAIRSNAARKSDVVITRNLPTVWRTVAARRPVLYDTYRPWPRQRPWTRPLFHQLAKSPYCIGIAAHSKLAASSFADAGFSDDKLLVAYNGFEASHFERTLSREEARRECDLPQEEHIVVYTGRMSLQKGVGLIIDMARRLPEVRFVLVGSENDEAVKRAAAQIPNVSLLGWMTVHDTVPYLKAADVLIIPPTGAPLLDHGNTVLPIKTFHYLAAGRPIFAPATPDIMELLHHGTNAYLVEPDDINDAVQGLTRLLSNAPMRTVLGENASRDARAFTWSARADRVTAFLKQRFSHGKHSLLAHGQPSQYSEG